MKKYSFLFLFLITLPGFAENLWQTHGHNFSYASSTIPGVETVIFPVAWDVRSANDLILIWQDIYSIASSNPIDAILQESYNSGFNAAVVRSELSEKWFPEQPGDIGDDFYPMAAIVRSIGLHLIAGGLKTNLFEAEHNQAVVEYLKRYVELTSDSYPGEIIGCFAFDEPDVKYLESPEHAEDWLEFISYWTQQLESELNLQSLCYFAKFASARPDGTLEYFADTTSVLNRMSRYVDMVGIDMYPAKNNFRRTDHLDYFAGKPAFVASTDLIQDDPLFSNVFTSRDELISVYPSGDSSMIVVENIDWDGIDLSLQEGWSSPLSFMPDEIASSDFRSGYFSSGGTEHVNSAVVFWKYGSSLDETSVLISRSGVPEFCSLNKFPGSDKLNPVFFTVGQTDYWRDVLQVEGIIGRGRLAILAGLESADDTIQLMLYVASEGTEAELMPLFHTPVQLNFEPVAAVWGTFWGTWFESGTVQAVASNGFVIYDESGDYVTLTELVRDNWWVYPGSGAIQYHDLFGSNLMPDEIRVSRVDGTAPPFFAGYDHLVGWYEDSSRLITARSNYSSGWLTLKDTVEVLGIDQPVTGFDFLRNDHRYQDRPVFTLSDGSVVLGVEGFESALTNGSMSTEEVNYCFGDTIITALRTMYSRDAIRSVLIPDEDGYYIPQCEIYSDVYDGIRFQWYPEAHQVGMNNGIEATDRDNALFAVVQSYGRHGFALPSYCVSPDTMLYMVTAPIVAGARGLVFYALDLAMMSGNGGDDGSARAPFILQNWGPSRDTENVDMVGVVHGAVASLTGNTGGTDYLSALVDPSWIVMDDSEIFNEVESDTLLNFIALRNTQGDSIVVIAVNESLQPVPSGHSVVLNSLPLNAEIVSSQGSVPVLQTAFHTSASILDYTSMNSVSASLITISTSGEGSGGNGWTLNSGTDRLGNSHLSFAVPYSEEAELVLYDLAGREVELLWSGPGSGMLTTNVIEKADHPAGLYFAVLAGDGITISEKCLLW